MRDLFRKRRMWRRTPDLKDRYDVVIIGGGSHGLSLAYYLARDHGITDVCVLEQGYIGSGAAGRNTTILRSNYKTLEGAHFYDASVRLYEGLSAELRFNLLFSQQGHLTLAHTDRAMFVMNERAEVNQLAGDRLQGDRAGGDRPSRAGDVARPRRDLSGDGRPVSPARRDHPPRRGGLGVSQRRGLGRRRDPPVQEGHWDRALQRARLRCGPRRRAPDRGGHRGQHHRRVELDGRRDGRRGAADHHAHPSGVRDRAAEAAARHRRGLLTDARLHLADRPRRVPGRGRDRARRPTASRAPSTSSRSARATRSSSSRSWSARGSSGAGPGSDITPDYSPILGRTEVDGFLLSAGVGHLRLQGGADRRQDPGR